MGRFVLAAIILNGAWTQLDAAGWPMLLLPVLILALDRAQAQTPFLTRTAKPASLTPVVAAAALCALHLAHVALTVREEFGFGGDEGYHLSATRAFAIYFLKAGPYLAVAAVAYVLCRRWFPSIAAALTTCVLIGASMMLPNEPLFGRYPTAFYLLATPLNVAFEAGNIPYPFSANHIVNVLSLPAWLFVLRPVIAGRWPDWRVIPVALLVYLQGPSLVYVGGALLEPWAFVFILLALETAADPDADRRWLPVLLAGIAALFKETAILFVPPIWLLTMVDWRGWRPSLRDGAIRAGIAAVAPFLTYYAVRRGLNIFRGYEIVGDASVWSTARLSEWLSNARFQLGVGGTITVAALCAWAVLGTIAHRAAWRQHVVWVMTAIALAMFFAADAASTPWTGYGRFLAYSLLALCGVMFVTARWLETQRRTVLIATSVIVAALQIGPAWQVFALDFAPDYGRNSLEWARTLVRFPIRSLANRLPEVDDGGAISKIRVIAFGTDLISLRVAYPDLAERYDIQGESRSPADPGCACRSADTAVIAVFEWPANFSEAPGARERMAFDQSACLAQLRSTCASMVLEQTNGGDIVGALGGGVR